MGVRIYLEDGQNVSLNNATELERARREKGEQVPDFDALICLDAQGAEIARFRFDKVIGWTIW